MALIFTIRELTFAYRPPAKQGVVRSVSARDHNGGLADGTIFRRLSLSIPRGARTAVVGHSGVGKSTLLYLLGLLGEHDPKLGEICYFPREGEKCNYGQRNFDAATLRNRDFGFALQSSWLMPTLTCEENIGLPLALQEYNRSSCKEIVHWLLKLADPSEKLIQRARYFPGQIAGGQRQRFALLRAIVHDPQVLFADEPFSNIDETAVVDMLALVHRWQSGSLYDEHILRLLVKSNGYQTDEVAARHAREPRTCMLVTHNLELALQFAEKLIVFHLDGQPVQNRLLDRSELPLDHRTAANTVLDWMRSPAPAARTGESECHQHSDYT